MPRIHVLLALASAAFVVAPTGNAEFNVRHGSGNARPEARRMHLGPGSRRVRFLMSEPAGVILLLRLTVPRGSRVNVTGRIPHLAGAAISTDGMAKCRRRGAVDVCAQAEEWCPMPAAAWRFVLRKLAGPPGWIRIDFVIGSPPSG